MRYIRNKNNNTRSDAKTASKIAQSRTIQQNAMSRHEKYISELRTANIRRKMLKYSHKNPHNEVWCPYEMTMRWNVNVNVTGSKYVTCVWCKV